MGTSDLKLTGKKTADAPAVKKIIRLIKHGGIGILPTDTLYGLVAQAGNKLAVAKIYRLRRRQTGKPFIILISSIRDLAQFGVKLNPETAAWLAKIWPGKVSVVLPCADADLAYLHRGLESLAFRLPADRELRALVKQTGPLVAPSANLEGKRPAATVAEAKQYFADKISFYADRGPQSSAPSTLIKFTNGRPVVLRRGALTLK